MNDKKNIWNSIQEKIRENTDEFTFNNWIKPISLKEINYNRAILKVPDKFFQDWIEENFINLIKDTFFQIFQKEIFIEFEIAKNEYAKKTKKQIMNDLRKIKKKDENGFRNFNVLNNNYRFETFIEGSNNNFAKSTARAVAENPGTSYNPLFIYGRTGLGKTHLLQAIGNYILSNNSNSKVFYITAEMFMNEMIASIQNNQLLDFRKKFRHIDILLIDDIHFLSKKEGLQEEFFHTFNSLYELKKQLVLTSDRPPKDIHALQERLVSRFEWGMLADIKPPNFETRIAILKRKMEMENTMLPEEVIHYIAEKIITNVRKLESALLKVYAVSTINKKIPTVEIAADAIAPLVDEFKRQINVDLIQRVIANYYDIRLIDMKTGKRTKNISLPRQIGMFLSRKLTNLSYPEIGEYFGGKMHSTVIYAIKKIESIILKNSEFKNEIGMLEEKILAG